MSSSTVCSAALIHFARIPNSKSARRCREPRFHVISAGPCRLPFRKKPSILSPFSYVTAPWPCLTPSTHSPSYLADQARPNVRSALLQQQHNAATYCSTRYSASTPAMNILLALPRCMFGMRICHPCPCRFPFFHCVNRNTWSPNAHHKRQPPHVTPTFPVYTRPSAHSYRPSPCGTSNFHSPLYEHRLRPSYGQRHTNDQENKAHTTSIQRQHVLWVRCTASDMPPALCVRGDVQGSTRTVWHPCGRICRFLALLCGHGETSPRIVA